jgi:hypothetical protein
MGQRSTRTYPVTLAPVATPVQMPPTRAPTTWGPGPFKLASECLHLRAARATTGQAQAPRLLRATPGLVQNHSSRAKQVPPSGVFKFPSITAVQNLHLHRDDLLAPRGHLIPEFDSDRVRRHLWICYGFKNHILLTISIVVLSILV